MIVLLFLVGTLLGGPSIVHAASADSLLILPFENATGSTVHQSLERGIPDVVTAYLAPYSETVQVVERERLDALMAENALSWENLLKDGKSSARLGQLAQARWILRGSILSKGDQWVLQGMLYETETTRLVHSVQAKGSAKELNRMCSEVADGLVAALSSKAKPNSRLDVVADPDPQRNLQMIYGLGYYHHHQYAKAIPEFMKMLARNPRDTEARDWLIKTYDAAGMKEHADIERQQKEH